MKPYESFKLYFGLKEHFYNSKYNYFKYGSSTYIKPIQFDKRRDKKHFYNLYKIFGNGLKEFYISCLLQGNKPVHNWYNKEYKVYHDNRLSRIQSIQKYFEDDCKLIVEYCIEKDITFKDMLVGDIPIVIHLYKDKLISLETFIIINKLTNFISKCNLSDKEKLLILRYSSLNIVSETGCFSKILRNCIEQGEMPLI